MPLAPVDNSWLDKHVIMLPNPFTFVLFEGPEKRGYIRFGPGDDSHEIPRLKLSLDASVYGFPLGSLTLKGEGYANYDRGTLKFTLNGQESKIESTNLSFLEETLKKHLSSKYSFSLDV